MILSETLSPKGADETKDHREISVCNAVLSVSIGKSLQTDTLFSNDLLPGVLFSHHINFVIEGALICLRVEDPMLPYFFQPVQLL